MNMNLHVKKYISLYTLVHFIVYKCAFFVVILNITTAQNSVESVKIIVNNGRRDV